MGSYSYYSKITSITALHLSVWMCVQYVIHAACTHSAILLPSSRLEGCELAVKMTRPPLVWFMSLGSRPLLSPHSGSGSLGTHAALSPSCGGARGTITSFKSYVLTLIVQVEKKKQQLCWSHLSSPFMAVLRLQTNSSTMLLKNKLHLKVRPGQTILVLQNETELFMNFLQTARRGSRFRLSDSAVLRHTIWAVSPPFQSSINPKNLNLWKSASF